MATAKTTKSNETKNTGSATAKKTVKPANKTAKKSTTNTAKNTSVAEEKKKILFVASESTPFIATGGLAEVIGSLSKALASSDKFDVRVVIPLYSDIKKEYRDKFFIK